MFSKRRKDRETLRPMKNESDLNANVWIVDRDGNVLVDYSVLSNLIKELEIEKQRAEKYKEAFEELWLTGK